MERRALVQWLVASGGMAAFGRLSLDDVERIGRAAHRTATPPMPQATPRRQTLDNSAARIVTVAAEHIIPSSDTPGATQAGVTAFIDTMLTDWYPVADRERFLDGVQSLERESRARGGRAFVDAPLADQLVLLQRLDADVAALRTTSPAKADAHWFAMLKFLTVWGYCTSEVGMRKTLRALPLPMRYDGAARIS